MFGLDGIFKRKGPTQDEIENSRKATDTAADNVEGIAARVDRGEAARHPSLASMTSEEIEHKRAMLKEKDAALGVPDSEEMKEAA